MTHLDVAILIITYNSDAEIAACVRAALRTGAEVVVIDNASTDATAETARGLGVRVIANSTNLGFAAAVNQGVRATATACLLLLNPDAVLVGGLEHLEQCCSHRGTGVAGGKLLTPAGVPQLGFNVRRFPGPLVISFECLLINRLWPGNWVNWRYRCLDIDLEVPQEVEQPAGAFLMFRRDVWQQLNGFDEGYFPIWFEDVDFCKRVRDNGFHVWYHPDAVAYHAGGHTVGRLARRTRTKYWYRSLLRYSIQHFSFFGRLTACVSVITGSLLRALLGGAKYRGPEMIQMYREVLTLAIRSIWKSKLHLGVVLQ